MMIAELSEHILKLSEKNIIIVLLWCLNAVETIGNRRNELFVYLQMICVI